MLYPPLILMLHYVGSQHPPEICAVSQYLLLTNNTAFFSGRKNQVYSWWPWGFSWLCKTQPSQNHKEFKQNKGS